MTLKSNNLESLLKKAKEHEKKCEWFQVAEFYGRAVDFVKDKHSIEATEFLEKMGFGFYKAAMQAPNNEEFRKRIKLAIQTYEKELHLLEGNEKENRHVLALIAYASSCLETNPSKKKKLLYKWWNFEKQAKEEFENIGDFRSAAIICVNLIEYSSYDWFWSSSSFLETRNIYEECLNLAEKAISILSKLEDSDEKELARAYCFASWYYSFSGWFWVSEEEIVTYAKKAEDYSNKALELAQNIGDAWLISQSYINIWNVNQGLNVNPTSSINPGKQILRYGEITKDNWCIGWGHVLTAFSSIQLAQQMEDPDKQRKEFEKSIEMTVEANKLFQKIHCVHELHIASTIHHLALEFLANIETNGNIKITLLEKLNRLIHEKEEFFKNREVIVSSFSHQLSSNLLQLAKVEKETEKKKKLLLHAKFYSEKNLKHAKEMQPFNYLFQSRSYFQLARVLRELAGLEPKASKKIDLLNQAADSMRRSLEQVQKRKNFLEKSVYANWFYFGRYYDNLGKILRDIYLLTKDKKMIFEGIETYKKAVFSMKKAGLPTHIAESYWQLAQFYDQSNKFQKASNNYESAAEAYDIAAKKIPQLEDFYTDYSLYMQAWSQIEQARYAHSIEEYDKAKLAYEKVAKLHESTEPWSYFAPNYLAWAKIEEAESQSRKEKTQQAKQTFQNARDQFIKAKESIKQKIGKITSAEEKELTLRLLQSSELRRKFCQARIQIEEGKLLDRKGKYLESSKSYQEATQNILSIVENVESEAERKELEYLAILCQAWEKIAIAEETASSGSYLESAELFERAKDYCYTKKASLWALGNSNFCRGLAAGVEYQITLDAEDYNKAKGYIQNAATNYFKAGYKNASKYAKATLRLFDAHMFMNQAERTSDTEKRVKKYQLAENLLQLASVSFIEAQQPEKTAQVKQILENVREEKKLAISFNQVLQAPSIASTTQSFMAPSPTREASVGLEQFQHANIQANLIADMKKVKVGESFCLAVEFINAGKEPALLTRVEDFVPPDFIVANKPDIYRLEDACLNMKGKQIAPLKFVEAKLVLQPSKKGIYKLRPTVHYLDELGQNKSLQLKSVEIKVEEVILPDRISTGTKELDSLLLGGIPKEYAIVLTGTPSDEREQIIRNFLETGTQKERTSFYVTSEIADAERLLKKAHFYLFLCNPKPKTEIPDQPNIYRLHGKADINNLNIALLQAHRTIEQTSNKRICINIISDVLANYTMKTARKWIAELTTDLISKGFTILAVINPLIHTPEELNNLLELFDGEINLYQSQDPAECKKSLVIKKLRNQDYIKNPICITKT